MFASVFLQKSPVRRSAVVGLLCGFMVAACGGDPAPVVRLPAPAAAGPAPQEPADETLAEPLPAAEVISEADDRSVIVALMLPLSGSDEETGRALLRAATMALFDAYDPRLVLLPLDTAGLPEVAEVRAQEAIDAGASVVLGPLLATNVEAAGAVLGPAGITMIGFSNDRTVAANGRFIMGFLPEAEVKRVMDHAAAAGHQRFAALVPEGRYGSRVRSAFGDAVTQARVDIAAIEAYPPDADALFEPVKRLARYDERRDEVRQEVRFLRSLRDDVTDEIAEKLEDAEVMEGVDFDAVLVPEGGALMRTLAPLLPFYEIDPNRVQLLGTGLWNDPGLLNEPPMQGAWFAAPAPEAPGALLTRFAETYGEPAPRLATLAYDAVSLVARLAREPLADADPVHLDAAADLGHDPRFSPERFVTIEGFTGVDGLFRFLPDGTIERALAVLEVNRRGLQVIDPAPDSFPAFGYAYAEPGE